MNLEQLAEREPAKDSFALILTNPGFEVPTGPLIVCAITRREPPVAPTESRQVKPVRRDALLEI
jgi:mRNA-degrading endonuclease toxin of MazEF toxin-antitoxin module